MGDHDRTTVAGTNSSMLLVSAAPWSLPISRTFLREPVHDRRHGIPVIDVGGTGKIVGSTLSDINLLNTNLQARKHGCYRPRRRQRRRGAALFAGNPTGTAVNLNGGTLRPRPAATC